MNSFPFAALVLINKLTKLRSLRKEIEAFHWLRNCVVFILEAAAEGGSGRGKLVARWLLVRLDLCEISG